MTLTELQEILSDIKYCGWAFVAGSLQHGFYIQVAFYAADAWQSGRKWYISTHATRSEAVQTALKAVLTAEEHEARERFRYKDEAIFFPHFDVDELVEQRRAAKVDRRTEVA